MEPREERRQELLDGKRIWSVADAGGDHDVFFSDFVVPLRDLKYAGFFDDSLEHKAHRRGGIRIDQVRISGAINFNAGTDDSA